MSAAVVRPFSNHIDTARLISASPATGRNACRTLVGERKRRNVESAVPGGSFSLARVPGMHYCAVPSVTVAEIHESEVFDFEYPPWIDLSKVTFFESREYPYG